MFGKLLLLEKIILFSKNVIFHRFHIFKKLGDLPTYDLSKIYDVCNWPKHHFNDANVVFMTCNDRQYWSKRTSKASTERLSNQEAGVIFLLSLRFRQIMSFLCDLSKIPFGKLPFGKLLCTQVSKVSVNARNNFFLTEF